MLHEAGLIGKETPIIGLSGADLREAYLRELHLKDAELKGADMNIASWRQECPVPWQART
jgi:uncharacterized protein YjbI with pentapeptide repeats